MDGDNIGRVIESLLITNKVDEVEKFSNKITYALEVIKNDIIRDGGKVIFYGGDSILFFGEFDEFYGEKILKTFNKLTNRTASMGIGKNTANTYLGLKIAKSKGGNQAINYGLITSEE